LLPAAVGIERRLDLDTGEERAIAITYGLMRMTIAEAYRLGVLGLSGQFDHPRAAQLLHAVTPP